MVNILYGDALAILKDLPSESVNCCVTSPPYYNLRNYAVTGQIGLEDTPEEYIEKLVCVFREVRRVLRKDGTLWLNIADTYAKSGKGVNRSGEHSTDISKSSNYLQFKSRVWDLIKHPQEEAGEPSLRMRDEERAMQNPFVAVEHIRATSLLTIIQKRKGNHTEMHRMKKEQEIDAACGLCQLRNTRKHILQHSRPSLSNLAF